MKTIAGVSYSKPTVTLLQQTGIGVPELAARTCYDSFELSENDSVRNFHNGGVDQNIDLVNSIEHSDLLDQLAWTHFHHSILEHTNLSYLIKGTSRGVLQEHARHRIQAISVRSTRYTMSTILNAFVASQLIVDKDARFKFFFYKIDADNLFVTNGHYNVFEVQSIIEKLEYQRHVLGSIDFDVLAIAKSSMPYLTQTSDPEELFNLLEAGKKKRNVGDNFKHIVTDNWKVDMVVTFNLRSLKNYLQLRDSGAAYFQIRWLAQAIKEATPSKYLNLIIKGTHNEA